MLTSLHLRNFQIHQRLDIELAQITTLVGRSDSGKSAALRALRWLAQNYPAGNEFIRDGAKFCRVRLVVDDHTITRRIGDKNEYKADDKRYVSFGRGVPTIIESLLNLTGDNFQSQLDGPFWFNLTPGQVAKELNRIINLSVIDNCLGNVATEARRAKATVDVTRQRLREAKEAEANLAHVPALAAKLKGLRGLEEQVARKRARIACISEDVERATTLARRAKSLRNSAVGGLRAVKTGGLWASAKKRLGELRAVVETVETQETKLCQLQNKIEGLQKQLIKQRSCPLCGNQLRRS